MNEIKFYCLIKKNKPVKRGSKIGEFPIYLRITINKQREEIVVKNLTCDIKEWDTTKGQVSGRTLETKRKNLQIENTKAEILNIVNEFERAMPEIVLNPKLIVDKMRGKDTYIKTTICEIFEEHNELFLNRVNNQKDRSQGTYERYQTVLKLLKFYIKKTYNTDDIPLRQINYNFLSYFKNYLLNDRKCCNNVAIKYLKNLKTILIDAKNKGLIQNDPFLGMDMKTEKEKPEFLIEEELQKIIQKDFTNERIAKVKDCFLFCCYTGLSYCDLKNLTTDNITEIEGHKVIVGLRKKTKEQFVIPLLQPAVDILNKYKNNEECLLKGKSLPVVSNQKLNNYLKEIASICGLEKTLHCHMARHTAATILLSMGLSIHYVSKILGHSSISMTQHYAKLLNKDINKAMRLIESTFIEKFSCNVTPVEL